MSERNGQPVTSDAEPQPVKESAGVRLTTERRNQGLSLGDIARQLKLSVRQVEALERDDYSNFSGPVFVRGFLRNYARLLHINPDELVAVATPSPVAPIGSAVAQETFASAPGSERPRRLLVGSILVALVVISLILLASNAARDHRESIPSSEVPALRPPVADARPTQPPAPATAAPSSPPAEIRRTTPTVQTPATVTSAPAEAPARGADSQPHAEATAPAAGASEPPKLQVSGSGPAQLKLAFYGDSWVQIRDGNGTTITSRLNPAGTERVIRGTPPFTVVVGNAQNVKLRYHDKDVDLQPHTRVDVARITLE